MKRQMEKRQSDRLKLLKMMRRGGWFATSKMIRAAGHRFSARVYDLRKLGCVIERQSLGDGRFFYRMRKGPKQGELSL